MDNKTKPKPPPKNNNNNNNNARNGPPPSTKKKKKKMNELMDFLLPPSAVTKKNNQIGIYSNVTTKPPDRMQPFIIGKKKVTLVQNPNPASAQQFILRRGKEREKPKSKKYTKLKKIILLERQQKYLQLLQDMQTVKPENPEQNNDNNHNSSDSTDEDAVKTVTVNNSTIPIPVSVVNRPTPAQPSRQFLNELSKIPKVPNSVNPREYCNQLPSKELNNVVVQLLKELRRFYARAKAINPLKAKSKRRLMSGLKEIERAAKSKKLKCVIMAVNIESAGGLDSLIKSIIKCCNSQQIPLVFALKKFNLGIAMGKRVSMSAVGIINYDGAENLYQQMIALTKDAKKQFTLQQKKAAEEQKKQETQQEQPKEEDVPPPKPKMNANAPAFVPRSVAAN